LRCRFKDDRLVHLPVEDVRNMGTREQFCRFAREPERRRIGVRKKKTR
jgi:hypothetical protein